MLVETSNGSKSLKFCAFGEDLKQRGERGGGNVLGAVHGIGGDGSMLIRFSGSASKTWERVTSIFSDYLWKFVQRPAAAIEVSSGQTLRIVGTKTGLLLFFCAERTDPIWLPSLPPKSDSQALLPVFCCA